MASSTEKSAVHQEHAAPEAVAATKSHDDIAPAPAVNDDEHLEDGKHSAQHEEYVRAGLNHEEATFLTSHTKAQEAAIFRKVDFRVVPMLSMLYLISHLDR
jgi:hypothetical protein